MTESNYKSNSIRISIISIIINAVLSALKLFAGFFGHSQALIADAVHSLSDVLTTVVVIVSLLVSGRKPDDNHEYGHQKYEGIATLLLALALGYVGIKIGISGASAIITGSYKDFTLPTLLPAIAALVSIVVKEAMYQVTMKVARKEKSSALKADAEHHRSDALSSVGSLAGVLFALFGFPVMDSVASIIICIFILKTAIEILLEALKGLTDSSADENTEEAIERDAMSIEGVERIDMLKTRVFGSGYYVDIEIAVDGDLKLQESHEIAEKVHDKIENKYPDVLHCMVHVNPYED